MPTADYLPGLILLCCPTATIAYIMARKIGGAADFVVAASSASPLLSAGTFLFWMTLVAGHLS